jgi:hypothetical protein
VRLRVHSDRWDAEALQGKPRLANQPPEEPRRGSVEGATASVRVLDGARAGGSYLRLDAQSSGPGSRLETAGGFVEVGFDRWLERVGLPWLSLDTYAEYDRATGLSIPPVISSPRAPDGEGYGLYFSQGLIVTDLLPGLRGGASWEFKDYQNFELAVNEPPTLVREHRFVLLNRSTHVLEPGQERGTQFEATLDWRDHVDLIFNQSGAECRSSRRFDERYLELTASWRQHTATLFADDASDGTEVPAVLDRDTAGGFARLQLRPNQFFEVDLELQRRDVQTFTTASGRIEDRYGSLSWSWTQRFSLAVVRQTTDDPQEATDEFTGEVSRRAYDSLQASVDVFENHQIILFWGRRRGGLACTSGTCYKVQPFDGVAARVASRF